VAGYKNSRRKTGNSRRRKVPWGRFSKSQSSEQIILGLIRHLTSRGIRNEIRVVDELITKIDLIKREFERELKKDLLAEESNKVLDGKIKSIIDHDRSRHPFAHFFLVEYGKVWSLEAKREIEAINKLRVPVPARNSSDVFRSGLTPREGTNAHGGLHLETEIKKQGGWGKYEKLVGDCWSMITMSKHGEYEKDEITDRLRELKNKMESSLPEKIDLEAKKKTRQLEQESKKARLEQAKAARDARKRREKAAAAAHFGKTRTLAKSVRKQISDQTQISSMCPYCNGILGDDPRADHIYPVSHGGLSTPENMVNICIGCNTKKSDQTLREFVKLMKFDMEEIEARLEILGKRF
jgi:5-methylcytosine-specific restriction endonuclease McrA